LDNKQNHKEIALQTLYTLAFIFLLPFMVFRLYWRSLKNPAYRKRLKERFALIPKRRSKKPCIWLHAVSVGETIAATPLVKQLQQLYPEHDICITTATPTGSERVRSAFKETVYHYYLPYDVPSFIRAFIKAIRPDVLIIMETELWPNLIAGCKEQDIPVMLANARLSAKSAKAYAKVALLSRPMLGDLTVVAAQSAADAKRFKLLGVKPTAIEVTGSIKFDIQINATVEKRVDELKTQLQLQGRKVAIFASTHPGEDEKIIPAVKRLNQLDNDFLAIIVPRHLERFQPVYDYCVSHGLSALRLSDRQAVSTNTQVIVGDSMGDMLALYGLANIAFIGGSLILHGGHNYLEAAAWGLPLLTGKSVHNFQAIAYKLQRAGGLLVLEDHWVLERTLENWLVETEAYDIMGKRAKTVFENNKGALQHLLAMIEKQL
jgi:3-deoxy-D-manno-octulosonic-acid transferase